MAKPASTTAKVLALLPLCLGTIVLFNTFDKYQVIGPELLTDNRFLEKLEHWRHSDPGTIVQQPGSGVAILQSKNPDAILGFNQTISDIDSFKLLRLSCDLKTQNMPSGEEAWHVARVVLVSNNQAGEPVYSRPYYMTSLSGRHDAWEHHEGVFPVYSGSTSVSLSVQMVQITGTLWVSNLSLRPLAEMRSFRIYRYLGILLWSLVGIWVIAPMIKSSFGNTQRVIVLVLALVVVAGVLLPETLKEYIGSTLFPSLAREQGGFVSQGTFQFLPMFRIPDIYKIGHFFLFALLAAAALYRKPFALSHNRTAACLVLFAFVTEVMQLFVPGRTALLSDFIVDSAGIAFGMASQWIVLARIKSG